MTRRVVFNADDLGMGGVIDRGVIAAARTGVVREASLCVTGSSSENAGALARAAGLSVGLHFSLTHGRALGGRLRGLTDRHGRFMSLERVFGSCLARVARAEEIERELELQLARARELGAPLTHLNGHHHVHVFPVVRDAVLRVLARERPLHVRVPRHEPRGRLRGALLATLGRRFAHAARRRGMALRTLPLVGLHLPGDEQHAAALDALLSGLCESEVELLLHPLEGRELVSRQRLHDLGVVPASYAEIHSSS